MKNLYQHFYNFYSIDVLLHTQFGLVLLQNILEGKTHCRIELNPNTYTYTLHIASHLCQGPAFYKENGYVGLFTDLVGCKPSLLSIGQFYQASFCKEILTITFALDYLINVYVLILMCALQILHNNPIRCGQSLQK